MISLVSLHLLAGRQHIACIVGVLTLAGLHHLAFFLVARYQLVFYMFDAMSQTNSSPCGYHGCAVWDLELGLGAVMHAHGSGMASVFLCFYWQLLILLRILHGIRLQSQLGGRHFWDPHNIGPWEWNAFGTLPARPRSPCLLWVRWVTRCDPVKKGVQGRQPTTLTLPPEMCDQITVAKFGGMLT